VREKKKKKKKKKKKEKEKKWRTGMRTSLEKSMRTCGRDARCPHAL
jgi:hypothetical protein